MADLKRIRGLYAYATAWDFDNDVQPHIEKLRRIQAEEFDSLLREVRANAWDEGFTRGSYDPLAGADRDASESDAANPYRKGN